MSGRPAVTGVERGRPAVTGAEPTTARPPLRRARRTGDEGAGSVLLLAVVAVTALLGGTLAVAAQAHTARTVTQAAADLGALAAAQSLVLPVGLTLAEGDAASSGSGACGRAGEVALRHGTQLARCVVEAGGVVEVRVERATVLGVARATARAGPVQAQG